MQAASGRFGIARGDEKRERVGVREDGFDFESCLRELGEGTVDDVTAVLETTAHAADQRTIGPGLHVTERPVSLPQERTHPPDHVIGVVTLRVGEQSTRAGLVHVEVAQAQSAQHVG